MGIGIDFGTTRTVVASADRGNYPIVSFESHAGDSVDWFPSVVAERAGELRFGFDALAVADDPSFSRVRSFKRLMAGSQGSARCELAVGSLRLTVGELVERFLAALAHALRTRSNLALPMEGTPVVIAAPANAFCTQRFTTLEAFRRAGFAVRSMMNEPSAAGFEYSHRHAGTLSARREHVVVYDLGGGTFDASLVRVRGMHHEVMATAGIASLGGDDFDAALCALVCERAAVDLAALPEHARGRLLDACRDSKEGLNASSRRLSVDLEAALGPLAPRAEVSLTAAEYYEAVTPLVDRTVEAMTPLIDRAEGDPLADVAGLYVVGGGSALPIVGRILRARFGRRVHRSPYPHAAVAIGLALASDTEAGFALDDRFSRNFGVFREAEAGQRATYDAIFSREVALPKPGEHLTVVRRYRAAHNVGLFRYFECADFDRAGAPRGDLAPMTDVYFPFEPRLQSAGADLAAVPVERLALEGPMVEEQYVVDANGMVELTMTDLDAGYSRTQRLGAPIATGPRAS